MSEYDKAMEAFWGLYIAGAPALVFSTLVGLSVGICSELDNATSPRTQKNSAITSFVNITGCTSIGVLSGIFWPIAMPLLSVGAIYNKWKPSTSKCVDKHL